MSVYTKSDLAAFRPRHDALVGIDSDGCVFDTMGVKQCDHFHPLIIAFWKLDVIEPQLRAAAEFVNLYSMWRGRNRYPNLLRVFELLQEWDAVAATGVTLPDLTPLRQYVESGMPLGLPSLARVVAQTGDAELARVLAWSRAVDADIDRNMKPVVPFRESLHGLRRISREADAIVVSQTPEAALVKEWTHHGLDDYVALIAGQELGAKAEHLQLAAKGKYAQERILLIGDAPGDYDAAREVQAAFYPIIPGAEEASWQRFHEEAFDRFLKGAYAGAYEEALVAAFHKQLPSTPPWKRDAESAH